MRRAAAIVSAAGAIVLGLLLPGAAWAAPALVVKTTVAPQFVYFADPVTARVQVLFDPSTVVPGSVAVKPSFGAWQEDGAATTSSANAGRADVRTWSFTISCLTIECLPKGTVVQPFTLPGLTVSAREVDGSSVKLSVNWPVVNVSGRFLPPATGNVRPTLRLQTAIPAPGFRLSPGGLALVLDLVGAVVLATALGLLAKELVPRLAAARRPAPQRSPLARALALVRQAQKREVDDRRRAAGLLARTLAGRHGLSGTASQVAWSMEHPSPKSLEELVREVEAELKEST